MGLARYCETELSLRDGDGPGRVRAKELCRQIAAIPTAEDLGDLRRCADVLSGALKLRLTTGAAADKSPASMSRYLFTSESVTEGHPGQDLRQNQ